MAEPQPPDVHEGAADPHAPTGTADDRKAAAALSKLDVQDDTGVAKEVDGKALDKAMKGLAIKGGKAEDKKNVKIEAADVKLLVRLPTDDWRFSERGFFFLMHSYESFCHGSSLNLWIFQIGVWESVSGLYFSPLDIAAQMQHALDRIARGASGGVAPLHYQAEREAYICIEQWAERTNSDA
ncbi:hypothetical protein J1614_007477 [Plenodomus biglobosus]|nr:hypothetical protein J1614_007477 [Plenodomus biglobosus]